MSTNLKERCQARLNWMLGLLKRGVIKMSSFWEHFRKKGETTQLPPSFDELFEEASDALYCEILQLSQEMWDYVKEGECAGGCGEELVLAGGWFYIERDYDMQAGNGKIVVKENDKKLLCPKCAKKLVLEVPTKTTRR